MPTQFNCPSCQRIIGAEVAPGTQVRCPLCGQVVTVPGAMGPPPTPEVMPYRVEQGPRSSGLAIGALVCGIVGLVTCPLVGLVGLVLGIVSLVKIGNQPARYGGKGMAIGGVCTGALSIVMVPVLISILLPSLSRARELSKRSVCAANMKGIGQALYIYAQDEPKGMFPEAGADWMGRLINAGNTTPKQFVCPSTADTLGDCSYIYVPGYGVNGDPKQIIVYEPIENHGGEGGNILYLDGHVQFVKSPQYEQAIAAIKLPGGKPWRPPERAPHEDDAGDKDDF